MFCSFGFIKLFFIAFLAFSGAHDDQFFQSKLLKLQKSRAWEIPEAEQSYTEGHRKDFQDHRNATVEGQDLTSTYVLHPCPRTGCPDFRMGWKGVMGQSVMEQGVTEWRVES